MDSILSLLVVLIIAGLSNWLQRRAQARQESEELSPPPRPVEPSPAPPKRPRPQVPAPTLETSLERELRRLLGGEPPPEPPPPPPVVVPPPPRIPQPTTRPPAPTVTAVPPRPAPIPAPLELVPQAATAAALQQAALRLVPTLRDRRKREPRRSESPVAGGRRPASLDLAALARDPKAARQAFVASLIFNPPKGMER